MTNGTLTPQTKIQVGLAITLVGSVGGLFAMVYATASSISKEVSALSEKIEARYISKDLFTSELESLRRERRLEFQAFGEKLDMQAMRLTEVKSEVAALRVGK